MQINPDVQAKTQKKSLFRRKPKARLKIGKSYSGKKSSFIAQGVVVFREWDPKDRKYYHWEEWELTGFSEYDSWVEYDHYTRKVTIYEPVSVLEQYSAAELEAGQSIQLTVEDKPMVGTVKEVGLASVDYLKGKMSYQLFKDDLFQYATVRTEKGEISIEDYKVNNKMEKDFYLGRRLTKAQQKRMFGKSLHPIEWKTLLITGLITGFLIGPAIIPEREVVCTPRTVPTSSPTSNTSTSNLAENAQPSTSENCTSRWIFFSGGVGGGVGK